MRVWIVLALAACSGGGPSEDQCAEDAKILVYADNDEDGFGADNGYENYACHADAAYIADNTLDCDDLDDAVNPDATEVCDPAKTDENCDGAADDQDYDDLDGSTRTEFPTDSDGDGWGHPTDTDPACHADAPYVADNTDDCDDADRDVGPPPIVSWIDGDGDGAGDRYDVGQNEVTCTPSPGRVTNDDDCADGDPSRTFDTVRYFDGDGDGFGDYATERAWCSADSDPRWVDTWSDCNDADAGVVLVLDSCNNALLDACGAVETTCAPTQVVTTSGWSPNFGGWSPRIGDVYDNGYPDVLLGTFDLRRDWSGTGDPDQADFQDEARLLIGTSTFDPASGVWDAIGVRVTLPLQPTSNLGTVHGVVAQLDATDPGDELVVADIDRNNVAQGSLWYVADPPVSPVDGDVLALSAGGNAHRILMPDQSADPRRRTGYALEAGDLDADGLADLIVTAPTFSYDDDVLYVLLATRITAISTLDDAGVVQITDTGVFADGLGVDVAWTPDFAALEPAIAVTTLGSVSDGPAVLVFEGDRLLTDGAVENRYTAWFTTDGAAPFSHERSSRATWTDLDGDGARDDLLFTVTDSTTAQLYVIEDPDTFAGRVPAASAATVVYDLPWPDCTEVEAKGTHVWLACPDGASRGVYLRGTGDPGVVLSFDLDLTTPGPVTLTTGTSDQLATSWPYDHLGAGGTTTWSDGTTDVVVFDHFTGWTDEGFSWVVAP